MRKRFISTLSLRLSFASANLRLVRDVSKNVSPLNPQLGLSNWGQTELSPDSTDTLKLNETVRKEKPGNSEYFSEFRVQLTAVKAFRLLVVTLEL